MRIWPPAPIVLMSAPKVELSYSCWVQVTPPSSVRKKLPSLPAMMPWFAFAKTTARRSLLVGTRCWVCHFTRIGGCFGPELPPPPLPQLGARMASTIRLPIDLLFTTPHVLHPGQDE